MRLINVKTLELEDHPQAGLGTKNGPLYAILSHRWSDSEVTYKDFVKKRYKRSSPGFLKITACCNFVAKYIPPNCLYCPRLSKPGSRCSMHDISFVWIDTCCIDKRSSAELSESINSMWNWYKHATYCLVYLADVNCRPSDSNFNEAFQASVWFTRGWTLQELLAPEAVIFCSAIWEILGRRNDKHILGQIASATCIDPRCLRGASCEWLREACVAKKLSWAATRTTARSEDMAYCLLGLLGVNMSLLYGEGGERAFRRLQFEIIAQSDDESIFAWRTSEFNPFQTAVLAYSPRDFANSGNIQRLNPNNALFRHRKPYFVTHKGIQIEGYATKFSDKISLENVEEDLDFGPQEMATVLNISSACGAAFLLPLNCSESIDGRSYGCAIILMADSISGKTRSETDDVWETPEGILATARVFCNTFRSPFETFNVEWADGSPTLRNLYLATSRLSMPENILRVDFSDPESYNHR